jgi:integrase
VTHVEDRWHKAGPDGSAVRTARYGTGRRWRVRYADPDGNEKNRSFEKKAVAEKFRDQVAADVLRGTYMDPDAGRVTFRKFAGEWLAAQRFDDVTRDAVESRLRNHVLPVFGDKRLDQITTAMVKTWLANLRGAPSTKAKIFTHLNTIMLAALAAEKIRVNPCHHPSIQLLRGAARRVVPWTPEQRASLRGQMPEHLQVLIDAGCDLGLRQSELFGLAVEEIDFLRRLVHVRQQVKIVGGRLRFALPKGSKERDVPLAEPTGLLLSTQVAEFARVVTLPWHEPQDPRRHGKPHTATLLFITPDGRPLHRNAFNEHTWHPAVKAATGLSAGRENGCHAMRHLYASTLIARRVDPRTVAAYLGHSDGGALVLRTYAHLMPDAEDRARKAIEEALAEARKPAGRPGDGPAAGITS